MCKDPPGPKACVPIRVRGQVFVGAVRPCLYLLSRSPHADGYMVGVCMEICVYQGCELAGKGRAGASEQEPMGGLGAVYSPMG